MKSSALRSSLTGLMLVLGSTAALPAVAQTVPAAAAASEDAVVLTPFTVSTDKDNGYAATETLAGTRMRTNLRDVGASLTVLTTEFIQDLGVTSLDKALLFTPSVDSVEGENDGTNRSSGSFLRYGNGQAYSIRGFTAGADASHDFFSALVANDLYNIERVTLSRGPNAMLFGVGGAQGVAVSSTKRAQLDRQKTQVQLQYDRWSSRRAAIDHNQPIVPGKLAVRLNALHAAKREYRLFEGNAQERVTAGLTWRPLAHTQLMVNHESYSLRRNVVPLTWAFDGGALQWLAKGAPTVNFLPEGRTWAAAGRRFVDAQGNPVRVAPGVTDPDGFIDSATDFDPRQAISQITAQSPTYITGLNLANPMVNTRYQSQIRADTFGGVSSQLIYNVPDPWRLFGISKDVNLYGGTWDDPSQLEHGRWTQVFLEQRLLPGLHLELAGQTAKHARSFSPDFLTTLRIDVDRYLPDGTVNPGFMVPYAEHQGQYRDQLSRATEYRGTLSYEFDAGKFHRWLGQHNVSALAQRSRSDSDQDIFRVFNLATVGRTGYSPDALAGVHIIRQRVYFPNGQVPYPLPDQHQLLERSAQLNGTTMIGGTAAEAAPVNLAMRQFLNPTKTRFIDDSLSLGWQAKWFKDRLITVIGYRKDDTESYAVPEARGYIDPAVPGGATNPLQRYYLASRQVPLDPRPAVASSGTSRTLGAVFHATSWLSLTYNRSQNFSPVANASWGNYQGEPAPNSEGSTADYGVRAYLLDGRLSIAFNRFQNEANDQARNANAFSNNAKGVLTRLRTNYKEQGDSHFRAMAEQGVYPVDSTDVSDTWSFQAKGYEMNLVFNPSAQWRLALTGSVNTNALGTHLRSLGKYLATDAPFNGLATWRTYVTELRKVAAGQRSSSFDLDPTNPSARAQADTDATYIEQQANSAERTYLDELAIEGITTHRNGKYAVNGVGSYRLANDGRLKGWSVGGNFRWRSPNTAGYERMLVNGLPTGILDASRPLKGQEYWDVGAMLAHERRIFRNIQWRLQLNVENLFGWRTPRPVGIDYDTEGVYGAVNAIVPVRWELRRPRNFILTSTFGF
jgi:outer membrane receptor for ferric coprogen and ferric-rhodotorulic acid